MTSKEWQGTVPPVWAGLLILPRAGTSIGSTLSFEKVISSLSYSSQHFSFKSSNLSLGIKNNNTIVSFPLNSLL